MKLALEDFKFITSKTPLIAFDLIIENSENEILVGRRTNSPAKGFLFLPGGRIFKDEHFHDAISRISKSEISIDILEKTSYELIGVFEHHYYKENYFNDSTFNTHYIVIALKFKLKEKLHFFPDDQNTTLKFLTLKELLSNGMVHQLTKAYFYPSSGNKL